MPGDGELRLEVEESGLRALIALLLVRGAPTTVALRDERRDGTGGGEQEIGECLRLAPAMAPHCADDVATQGHRLLPDFEITNSGRHWREDVASFADHGINRMRGSAPRCTRARTDLPHVVRLQRLSALSTFHRLWADRPRLSCFPLSYPRFHGFRNNAPSR